MRTSVERLTRGASPVTVNELTAWLRVDSSDESASMFSLLIDASTDAAQEYIGRSIVSGTYRKTWTYSVNDCFFSAPEEYKKKYKLEIPYPKISAITSLVWRSSTGVESPITSYVFNVEGNIEIIGTTVFTATITEVICEYETTAMDEAAVKMAILKAAAYMYERRGDCDSAAALSESGAAGLLAPYRRVLL